MQPAGAVHGHVGDVDPRAHLVHQPAPARRWRRQRRLHAQPQRLGQPRGALVRPLGGHVQICASTRDSQQKENGALRAAVCFAFCHVRIRGVMSVRECTLLQTLTSVLDGILQIELLGRAVLGLRQRRQRHLHRHRTRIVRTRGATAGARGRHVRPRGLHCGIVPTRGRLGSGEIVLAKVTERIERKNREEKTE